jgi:uncharacterized protein (TIRG00374 family)
VTSFARRHAWKLAASIAITTGLLYTLHQSGMELVPDVADFDEVRWWAVALAVPLLVGRSWFRSSRWRFQLRSIAEVGTPRVVAVGCIGAAAVLLLPLRMGELVRPYLIRTPRAQRREAQLSISMTAAAASVVAERVIDGLSLSILLAVLLVVVPTIDPLPRDVVGVPVTVAHVRWAAYATVGFAAAFAAIVAFYVARRWARAATLAVFGVASRRLADTLAATVEKLADGLRVFGNARDLGAYLAETALQWTLNAIAIWLLAWACGVAHGDGTPITFMEACALMGVLGCASLLPGPPGLLGVFQAGLYAGMTFYYPSSIVTGPGAAFVLLLYVLQTATTLACGVIGLWYESAGRGLRAELRTIGAALES